jgi:hypothetical protein
MCHPESRRFATREIPDARVQVSLPTWLVALSLPGDPPAFNAVVAKFLAR